MRDRYPSWVPCTLGAKKQSLDIDLPEADQGIYLVKEDVFTKKAEVLAVRVGSAEASYNAHAGDNPTKEDEALQELAQVTEDAEELCDCDFSLAFGNNVLLRKTRLSLHRSGSMTSRI